MNPLFSVYLVGSGAVSFLVRALSEVDVSKTATLVTFGNNSLKGANSGYVSWSM